MSNASSADAEKPLAYRVKSLERVVYIRVGGLDGKLYLVTRTGRRWKSTLRAGA
jgi:hypothetical protein